MKTFLRDMKTTARAFALRGGRTLDNLYFPTVQKSGSQWISAIFSDRRMARITRLVRMPQRNYEYGEHVARFPRGVFVPGLYVSYQTYRYFIEKPEAHKAVYIYRDPRDLVVSDYHSTMKTHAENPVVLDLRRRFAGVPKREALSYFIRFNDKFSVMRSWVELGREDPDILFLKFEDITSRPLEGIESILRHCGLDYSAAEVSGIVGDYTKDRMRERDLAHRQDKTESHYRFKSSSHRDEFEAEHYQLFREVTGNLIEVLGYEP